MRFSIASLIAIPLVLIGQTAVASPLETRESLAPPPGFTTITPNTGFEALSSTVVGGSVTICGAKACAGTCYTYTGLYTGLCFSPPTAFWSAHTTGLTGGTVYASNAISQTCNHYTTIGTGCTDTYPISMFSFAVV